MELLIIHDYRTPKKATDKIRHIGQMMPFKQKLLSAMPLHGHPDLFMCQTPDMLVLAPNIEEMELATIQNANIPYVQGYLPVEPQHPFIARYNAVVTRSATICNPNTVDPKIMELSAGTKLIEVKQSYNRCSTIALSDNNFLTSDSKTHQQLLKNGFESHLIDPKNITLEGYPHGLFGGCAGICNRSNTLYTIGELNLLPNYNEIIALIHKSHLKVCCLSDLPLQDVGGLFFLEGV